MRKSHTIITLLFTNANFKYFQPVDVTVTLHSLILLTRAQSIAPLFSS